MAQRTPGRRFGGGRLLPTATVDDQYEDDFDETIPSDSADGDDYLSVDGQPPLISGKQPAVHIGAQPKRQGKQKKPGTLQPPGSGRAIRTTLAWGGVLALLLAVMVGLISHTALTLTISPLHASGVAVSSNAIRVDSAVGAVVGQPPAVTAQTAFLFDPDTGAVYYAKGANVELPMASCTKVMTLLLAVERGNLNQMVTVGADAHALVNPDSSYMGLDVGEKISLRDLLYGLVLPSGNDAAVAIADAIGGNVPAFVAMMNQRAQQLGLTHTHYANPHGLDAPGHYTTARDLAVLSAYALRNPIIEQVVSTYSYNIPKTTTHKAYHLVTGNDLLPYARAPYPGAIGVKPGFTGNAGYCMSFAADRRGHLLVAAVLDDPSWQVRIVDMRTLLDWGYQQFGLPAAPSPTPGSDPSVNT